MQPYGYYMNGSCVNVVALHKANLAVNQSVYIPQVLLPLYPSETVASIEAAQAKRVQIYSNEVL